MKQAPGPSMINRKPYRSKELKAEARANAVKVDGRWVSPTKVLFHENKRKGAR